MKKFFVSALVAVSMLTAGVSTSVAATSFVDIEGSYAKDAITDLQAKGIIDGMDISHFVPDGTVSRAQFVTIMVRALGLQAKATISSFTDVTDWAIPYAEAAYKAGIIEGVADGLFDPNASITREAAATILVRTLSTKGKLDQTDAVNFTDSAKISSWAKPFIAVAQKYALISGFPDGSFDPQGIANRAMAATMGKNLLAAIAKVVAVVPTTPVPTVPTPEITPTTPVIIGGGGGGGRHRSSNNTPVTQDEVPAIIGGKATFSNGTTIEGLPAGSTITGKVASVAAVPGIETAGQAMDFTFTGNMPAEGLTLSLPTTSDNAGLSYFNAARSKWELQDGSTIVTVGSTKFVKTAVHHFSIYGPIVKSAQLVADSITTVTAPTKDVTSLTLPKVADGFTVAINSSSNTDVIALDGTIVPPAAETTVSLVLQVTRTSDGSKALTASFSVVVPAKTTVITPTPDPNPEPDPQAVVEFQVKPSFIGAFTSDFKAKVNNEYVTNYSLYYDGKLVGTTTNGIVTSVNNVFSDVSKIKITDTVDRTDSDATMGTW